MKIVKKFFGAFFILSVGSIALVGLSPLELSWIEAGSLIWASALFAGLFMNS